MTRRRERAALLVAEDKAPDLEIAAVLKIGKATLERWKREPAFAARVQEHRARWAKEIEIEGIANRKNRVDALNDRWSRMREVIRARAEDMTDEVAGGDTGLLVRTVKQIGSGERATTIEEYAVDTGLLKSMLDHEKQAAQELGQWADKQELSGPEGGTIKFTLKLGDGDQGDL